MGEPLPKLRHIEAFPVRQKDQQFFCLHDPHHWTDQVLTVSPAAVLILQCLDGKHSMLDVQDAFARATSKVLPSEQLQGFLDNLDRALMLDSPRFHEHRDRLIDGFRQSSVREPYHSGRAYPDAPGKLRAMFEKHFEPPKGPGRNNQGSSRAPAAIVSPHIDLRRGGPGFAWAYGQLADAEPVDLFVILGVAHQPTRRRFTGTKKHFRTPLGVARTNHSFLDALSKKLPFDLFEDEFAHRSEHSVEFQVLYLQHAIGQRYEFEIAPILVGSFHEMVESGEEPISDPEVAAFAKALRETISGSGKTVCVIAGVDLAHVGGRFGHEFTVNEGVRSHVENEDREMLKRLESCDASGFFQFIHKERDARHVCGFPALYTMVSALDLERGQLLYYDQSFEKDTNSVVSFASMKFS